MTTATFLVAVAGIASFAALLVRRIRLGRATTARAAAEERVRPQVLALIAEGREPSLLTACDAAAFAALLTRYARQLTGDAQARITTFFTSRGLVARALMELGDRRGWRRARAAYALGGMGSQTAIPGLLAVFDDPEREVRTAAARSLGKLAAAESVRHLVEALAHRRVPRVVAADALLSIGPPAVPGLRSLLEEGHVDTRAAAVELLGLLGNADDAPSLMTGLGDFSPAVRSSSALALGRLGAAQSTAALRRALGDRSACVRTAAAKALGAIGDRDAVPALLEHARSDSFDPAQAAARALARIDPSALASAASHNHAGAHLVEAADIQALRAA